MLGGQQVRCSLFCGLACQSLNFRSVVSLVSLFGYVWTRRGSTLNEESKSMAPAPVVCCLRCKLATVNCRQLLPDVFKHVAVCFMICRWAIVPWMHRCLPQ